MPVPLASFPIVSTRDPDEAEFVLSRELADLRFARVPDRGTFGLQMNGVRVGRTSLLFNSFETDTLVDAGVVDGAVLLTLAVGSPAIMEIDGERVICGQEGAIISPARQVLVHRPAGSAVLVLKAGIESIEDRFREILDRRPGDGIRFRRSVDLGTGVGAHIRRLLHSTAVNVESNISSVENQLLRAGLDDLLLNALLALPNNYSNELLRDPPPTSAPGLVRRAEEFLEARATEAVTISQAVAECGCSRTALYSAFHKHRGYTPLRFLTECRLRAAHQALLFPQPGDTVASIANANGFFHLGRFSAAYRRRFGEAPSETLRRA